MGFRGSVDFRAQGDDVKARKAHAEHHGKAETFMFSRAWHVRETNHVPKTRKPVNPNIVNLEDL